MSRVRWSQTAVDDLQRIAEFIRAFNPALEKSTVAFLIERAQILEQYPRIGQRRTVEADGTEQRALLAGKRYRYYLRGVPERRGKHPPGNRRA